MKIKFRCRFAIRPVTVSLLNVSVPLGASVRQAIDSSCILERHPELNLNTLKIGFTAN
jgi:putative ubiquitin-RnfH superfamily antitoxin RatB of RatAB toxin-antitoxin module